MFSLSGWKPALGAVLMLTVASATTIAQQAQAPGAATADKGGQWKHSDHHFMMPGEMIEARLAYIKTALQITPAQTAQWNVVADLMRKQAKARDAKIAAFRAKQDGNQQQQQPEDLIGRLEHHQKALTDASAELSETIAAWKPLYASLSDSQKEIAATLIGRGHGHHGWHHGFDR
jgi:hypothetical protein